MRVFFKWFAIIFLSVISVFVYRAYQDKNDGVLEEMSAEKSATIIEETMSEEEPVVWQRPSGWFVYENTIHAFSLAYPEGWEVQEALKPTQEYALHEISVHEKEYEIYRASFIVRIFERSAEQTVIDWWNARLTLEDVKKEECITEHGDSPCLYLRDMIDMEEETELAGELAYKVQIFQFDHQQECVYVAKDQYVYGLCYDSSNPNDPDFGENKITTENMLRSFVFGDVAVEGTDAEAVIQGMWQSVEDKKAVLIFGEEGVFENIYDGESMGEGEWRMLEEGSLETVVGDEVFLYTVLGVTEEKLTLSFVPRGNTLEYIRVIEAVE
ncbi:MAG: hypothetical protein KAS07_03780 [Candidatus Pacebacteria bacterium]|nr:hypothetical protein [Candidatus Paceibacterota bacterium]